MSIMAGFSLMEKKHVDGAIKSIQAPARVIEEAVISNDAMDRDHDILENGGIETAAFEANPVFLKDHDHRAIIGKVTRLWREVRPEGKALMMSAQLLPPGVSVHADQAWAEIQHGARRGISIGFLPLAEEPLPRGGRLFRRVTLLEVSSVAIPSCPACLIVPIQQEVAMTRATCACTNNEMDLSADQLAQLPAIVKSIFAEELAKHRAADIDVDEAQLRRVLPTIVAECVADEIAGALRRAAGRVE